MKHTKISKSIWICIILVIIITTVGIAAHSVSAYNWQNILLWPFSKESTSTNTSTIQTIKNVESTVPYQSQDVHEQRVINSVKKAEKSVVSIVASKDLPIIKTYQIPINPSDPFNDFFGFPFNIPQYYQKQEGTKKQEVSAGSGFIIDSNGYIITNKHVVQDTKAEYTVLLNDGTEYSATVIARDPLEDFALVKINKTGLVPLILGNSDNLMLGQTAIAIGNALGELQNTVSVGVVSGLHRNITAYDTTGEPTTLTDLIQTDAAINQGNSGGPLLNLNGEVIGVNVAMEQGAQNIGFAIPISKIKGIINQAISTGKISVPFIGIHYTIIDKDLMKEKNLSVDYGALIGKGANNDPAIVKGSPAEKAGLKENDIILSINNIKITAQNSLSSIVRRFNIGDKVKLEVLRDKKTIYLDLILGSKDSTD